MKFTPPIIETHAAHAKNYCALQKKIDISSNLIIKLSLEVPIIDRPT